MPTGDAPGSNHILGVFRLSRSKRASGDPISILSRDGQAKQRVYLSYKFGRDLESILAQERRCTSALLTGSQYFLSEEQRSQRRFFSTPQTCSGFVAIILLQRRQHPRRSATLGCGELTTSGERTTDAGLAAARTRLGAGGATTGSAARSSDAPSSLRGRLRGRPRPLPGVGAGF